MEQKVAAVEHKAAAVEQEPATMEHEVAEVRRRAAAVEQEAANQERPTFSSRLWAAAEQPVIMRMSPICNKNINAPINCMPHYPPTAGRRVGHIGDLTF